MSFITDKQTLDDLNLLGKFRPGTVYTIFNRVKTAGGERLLDAMFLHPLGDAAAINRRSALFAWFQEQCLSLPAGREELIAMEQLLDSGGNSNRLMTMASLARKKLMAAVLKDEAYQALETGLHALVQVLAGCMDLLAQVGDASHSPYRTELEWLANTLHDPRLAWLKDHQPSRSFSLVEMARYLHLLRHTLRPEMEQVLDMLYHLDVFIAVSVVARDKKFSYALALPAADNVFEAVDLRHPGLDKGVGNALDFNAGSNVLFLTGANMAGKSTFMKAFGIAVYLAHMGFPVAAEQLRFSVRDGLYTSINVPDNIHLGYSHFYAEVLRVKQVAEAVGQSKKLVILFDELFKGTNVKDAYDATLAVTEAFAAYRASFFIISTHIIELGEALQHNDNLRFSYLPTMMENGTPRYTYQLQPGITSDRQGMIIIENEKILEILGG